MLDTTEKYVTDVLWLQVLRTTHRWAVPPAVTYTATCDQNEISRHVVSTSYVWPSYIAPYSVNYLGIYFPGRIPGGCECFRPVED